MVSRRSLLRIPRSSTAARDIDFGSAHERVLRGWESGSHEGLLRAIAPAAEILVEFAAPAPGEEVLDAGAGDGNLALSAARAGADVYACDVSLSMVERGRSRGEAEGLEVAWRVADVQDLPYPDAHFDAVLSSFGASHAPEPCAPPRSSCAWPARRLVGLTAWVPAGCPGAWTSSSSGRPVSRRRAPPDRWGVDEVARGRLGPLLEDLQLRTRTLRPSSRPPTAFETLLLPTPWTRRTRGPAAPFDRLLTSCNTARRGSSSELATCRMVAGPVDQSADATSK